jgi:diguanylate cyclase
MAEHDRTSSPRAKPSLGWFRFGRNSGSADAAPRETSEGAILGRVARESRRDLLDAISTFLIEQDLAITPANLAAACKAYSGASPNLMRRIAEKTANGERITQNWLDEVSKAGGDGDLQEGRARKLLQELDDSLTLFTRSTKDARTATTQYQSQLDQHIVQLDGIGEGVDVVSRLASLAGEMAERTRKAEAELRSSEEEAKGLRRRLNRAKRDAERDHLTGLPNRRAFEAELERQYSEAAKAMEPLSIAFCDIDHFKRINDNHGHDAGDRVLKVVAQVLEECSDKCHVSRHGGEEFVLLFRGVTPVEAKVRLDRAREGLAIRNLFNRETDQPFGTITFSAGIANVFAHDDPRNALKAADHALYRAKETGRNQIVVA